jgi:hypothetical protein
MGIPEFVENFISIDFEKLVKDSVFENEAELVDALHDQLQTGRDQMGDYIGEYKDERNAKLKFSMNPRAGFNHVDLKLEGDLYSGMQLEEAGKDFQIRSTDSKSEDLVKRYGEWFYGLQDHNIGKVAQEDILPVLQDNLRALLDV